MNGKEDFPLNQNRVGRSHFPRKKEDSELLGVALFLIFFLSIVITTIW